MHASSVHPRRIPRPAGTSPPQSLSQCAVRTRDKRAAAAPPPLGRLITEERKPTKNRRVAVHANPSQVRPRRPVRRPVEEDAGRQEEERTIPASRGAAAPSRHRRDSYPSDEVVGGFFSILRPFGPRRATAMPRAGCLREEVRHEVRGHGRGSTEAPGQRWAAGRAEAQKRGGQRGQGRTADDRYL